MSLSLLALVAWVWVAASRFRFPYSLEWMEGGVHEHVARVRGGAPLYVAPGVDFAPFPYTPLYYWVSAPLSSVAPESLAPLRLVSIAAAVGLFGCVAALAARFHGAGGRSRWLPAALAAGALAAANEFTGAFLDLARVDALAWALGAAAWLVASRARLGTTGAAASGALAGLAFLTKQSTGLLGVTLALAAASGAREGAVRRAATHALAFAALTLGARVRLDAATDGWFGFWTFDLLRDAPVHAPAVLGYWRESALALGTMAAVAVAAGVTGAWRPPLLTVALPAVALVATGWIGRAHAGGYDNNLLPTALAAAVLFGAAGARWLARPEARLAPIAVALALVPLAHDPRALVPGADAERAGDATVVALRQLGGPLLVPDHPRLQRLALGADARTGAHGMAWIDLLQSGEESEARAFLADVERALGERRYAAVVTSERWDDMPGLAANYGPPAPLLPGGAGEALVPPTGAPRVPRWVYRVRPD